LNSKPATVINIFAEIRGVESGSINNNNGFLLPSKIRKGQKVKYYIFKWMAPAISTGSFKEILKGRACRDQQML